MLNITRISVFGHESQMFCEQNTLKSRLIVDIEKTRVSCFFSLCIKENKDNGPDDSIPRLHQWIASLGSNPLFVTRQRNLISKITVEFKGPRINYMFKTISVKFSLY